MGRLFVIVFVTTLSSTVNTPDGLDCPFVLFGASVCAVLMNALTRLMITVSKPQRDIVVVRTAYWASIGIPSNCGVSQAAKV